METSQDLLNTIIDQQIGHLAEDLTINEVIFKDDKKRAEALNEALTKLKNSLLEANVARRDFKIQEKQILKDFKKEAQKNKTTEADQTKDAPVLISDLEKFFSPLSSSLNEFAKVLGVITDTPLSSWETKEVEGVKKAGLEISEKLSSLTNPGKEEYIKDLSEFVSSNARWLGFLLSAKNEISASIIPITFSKTKRKITPMFWAHHDGYQEPALLFMTRALHELLLFIMNTTVLACQVAAKDSRLIKVADAHGHTQLRWVPNELQSAPPKQTAQ